MTATEAQKHREKFYFVSEARSKFDHIAGVPLRPDVAELLHNVYLAKGVHGTTAIEGTRASEQRIAVVPQREPGEEEPIAADAGKRMQFRPKLERPMDEEMKITAALKSVKIGLR